MGAALDYYYNKSKIWLPMKAEQHDPSNTTGTNILVDGDMEAAGVTSWNSANATLTKDTVNPISGAQSLRITSTGGNAQARQMATLVVGQRYRLTGKAKSDGIAIPYAWWTAVLWTGTLSTDVQEFSIEFTADATQVSFGLIGSLAGQYAIFDDLEIELIQARTLDVSGYGNHALLGDGTTPTTMPTKLQKRGYHFIGGSRHIRINGSFEDTNTYTIVVKDDKYNIAGDYYIDNRLEGGGGYVAWSGANLLVSSGITYINKKQTNVLTDIRGLRIITVAGLVDTALATVSLLGARFNFNGATALLGDILHFSLIPGTLTAPQVADLHTRLLAEVNHV